MPLLVRPYQPADGATLLARFAADTRPPWLRLPPPLAVEDLLVRAEGLSVFVAETGPDTVVGLIAIDERGDDPLLLGPLLSADQLADLFGKSMLKAALVWCEAEQLGTLLVKLDLGEDHAMGFFLNHGFRLQGTREHLLAARPGQLSPPECPDGLRIGQSPDMLSSDYIQLYGEIGADLGWRERLAWTRPQVFEHLQRPDVLLFAARAGTSYLGFAELRVHGGEGAELTHFGVLPAFRGRRVGTALLAHVLWHCTEVLGHPRVWLTARTDDSGRLAFDPARHGLRQERVLVYLEKRLIEAVPARYGSA
ncbi:MAG: GNAT family N-acetyltransferase [Candidatus Sericytochromatia bacterium]|nr:GNAT family N-acetyltransferase [Candidatus Sericytochromatia bacterium]